MVERGAVAVRWAVEGELELLDPAVRTSPERIADLLDEGFVEVGRSGRRWDRAAMLAELPAMDGPDPAPVGVEAMAGRELAPGWVHLTYVSVAGGVRAWRSSLWRHDGTRWRMYHHQGTAAAD